MLKECQPGVRCEGPILIAEWKEGLFRHKEWYFLNLTCQDTSGCLPLRTRYKDYMIMLKKYYQNYYVNNKYSKGGKVMGETETIIKVETLLNKSKIIKEHLMKVTEILQELINFAQRNDYIEPKHLSDSVEFIQDYNRLQEDFFQEINEFFPGVSEKSIPLAEKMLEDAMLQLEVCNSALTALNQFQLVDIDHEETRQLLSECKKRALLLAENKYDKELVKAAEPYKTFIETVGQSGRELTATQEEIIELEFPRPIPRMLYQGKFFFIENSNLDRHKDNSIEHEVDVQQSMENLPIDSISESANEVASPMFIFRTDKKDTTFKVKQFLSEIRNSNGHERMKFLYVLGWCRLLTFKQLSTYALESEYNEEMLDVIIRPFLKEGYLTEILSSENGQKYYCFSPKGSQIFVRKDSTDEFRRKDFSIPKIITDHRLFENCPTLIEKLVFFNERALFITEKEIPYLSKYHQTDLKTKIVYRETPEFHIPYAELIVENFYDNCKKYVLFPILNFNWEEVSEINETLKSISSEELICFVNDGDYDTACDFLHSLPVSDERCYLAYIESDHLVLSDLAGNRYESIKLVENLLLELDPVDTDDSERLASDFFTSAEQESLESDSTESESLILESQNPELREAVIVVDPVAEIDISKTEIPTDNSENLEISDPQDEIGFNIQNASAIQVAKSILSNKTASFASTEFAPLIYRLLAQKSIIECIVLAKALSLVPKNPDLKVLYSRLLYATNMSIEPHRYTGLALNNLDLEETSFSLISRDTLKMLRISSFAWALFMPSDHHDYSLYNNESSIMSQIEEPLSEDSQGIKPNINLSDLSPALKQVFAILFDLKNYSPIGFSNKVLSYFLSENNRNRQQEEQIQRAKDLLQEPQIRQYIRGVPEVLSACFGKRSDLFRCMHIIYHSKFEERWFVQSTLDAFVDQGIDISDSELPILYSDEKIQNYIDTMWKQIEATKVDKLKYSPRNTVEVHIKKRLDVIRDWLDLNNNTTNSISKDKFNKLTKIKNNLLTQLKIACDQLEKEFDSMEFKVQAGICVLQETFKKLISYLDIGKIQSDKWEYAKLLESYQMNLNDDLKPNINPKLQDVAGFEPWRRMLQHIISPKISPIEALKLIDSPCEQNWYDNYGTAEHLNQYLFETLGRPQDDLTDVHIVAKLKASQDEELFKSEFELKYAYGCIEESTKESVFHTVSVLNSHFMESGDFAQYRAFLDLLKGEINKESLRLKKTLSSRVKELKERDGLIYETAPILKNIEKNLEEHNFAVAEEYLNRLDHGEKCIPEEELEVDNIDYHDQFVKRYENLYKICSKNKGNALSNWGFTNIQSEFISSWSKRHRENAKNFIESWPRGSNSENTNYVFRLLKYLGLDALGVEKDSTGKTGDKYYRYKVSVSSIRKHLRDYPHPISSFGTLMNKYIHVVCLFGTNSANELINVMANKLQLGGNTIVLMDGTLSISDRRKVAEQFKSQTSGQNSFLLIDRVLMLYLATLDQGERLVAMLKCTLPYTFYQPFSKDGGSIADEMFFGRKAELNDILHPTGACLVYGGRQLGKTALLERAKSIAHQPSEKKYAIYISIFQQKLDGLIKRLCDELMNDPYSLIKTQYSSLEGICKELERGFASGNIAQLQLFIDETDDFLGDASFNNYSELRPLLDLKRKTKNQFKFVLAGLHNVARSKRALDDNGILPQLGAPLCIKPLSPTDARKLVAHPLSYLGFQIGGRQLAIILANTNYYPGILHFFCYTLVQSVSDNYKAYYSVANGNPPYELRDDQLKTIFSSEDLNKSIKDKLHMTLNLDKRYKMLANIFAYLYYEDEKKEIPQLLGYDLTTVKRTIKENSDTPYLRILRDEELEALLFEMVDMGILWSKPGSKRFRFRKNSFVDIIGSEDAVIETLLLDESEASMI